jgi:hypothetical protein
LSRQAALHQRVIRRAFAAAASMRRSVCKPQWAMVKEISKVAFDYDRQRTQAPTLGGAALARRPIGGRAAVPDGKHTCLAEGVHVGWVGRASVGNGNHATVYTTALVNVCARLEARAARRDVSVTILDWVPGQEMERGRVVIRRGAPAWGGAALAQPIGGCAACNSFKWQHTARQGRACRLDWPRVRGERQPCLPCIHDRARKRVRTA